MKLIHSVIVNYSILLHILPGQQKSLQFVELLIEPLQSFPPHEGLGLSHTLV